MGKTKVTGLTFPPDREAVSPVMGTVLMVAITVVLAGGLFVVVRTIGQGAGSAPELAFNRDEANDYLCMLRVDPVVDRSEFEVRMTVQGDFDINQDVPAGQDALSPGVFVAVGGAPGGPPSGTLQAGNCLSFCVTSGPAQGVEVTLRHSPSNKIIWKDFFLSLESCPA